MKKTTLKLFVFLILTSSLFLSCNSKGKQESKQQEAWEQEVADLRTTLINHHNPIIFPPIDFGGRKVFTYTLQKLLRIGSEKRVLFDGILDDITKEGDQFLVHLSSFLSDTYFDRRAVRFHLECEHNQVKSLIEYPPKYDAFSDLVFLPGKKDFLVVCVITDVKKIVNYAVQGSKGTELEIELPSTFSATGRLVEMVRYPEKES